MREVIPMKIAAMVNNNLCGGVLELITRDNNEDGWCAGYVVWGGHKHRGNSFKLKVDIPNFDGKMNIEETIDLVFEVERYFKYL